MYLHGQAFALSRIVCEELLNTRIMGDNATNIRAKQIYRVTLLGMFVNMALFAFKLVAGIVGRSGAMIADAVHSASDFATTGKARHNSAMIISRRFILVALCEQYAVW